jgi:hypothetical protein
VAALGRAVAALGRAVAAFGRMAALGLLAPAALDPVVVFLAVPIAVLMAPARPVGGVLPVALVLAAVPATFDFLPDASARRAAAGALFAVPADAPFLAPAPRAVTVPRAPPVVRAPLAVVDFAPGRAMAVVARLAAFPIEVLRPPAPFDAATGFAADMVLAAAVSALDAALIALVAAFIACSAVDMVLADEVALVAALVILVAAEVTFAAAEDTVRAAAAWVIPARDGDWARAAETRRAPVAEARRALVVPARRALVVPARRGLVAEVRRIVVPDLDLAVVRLAALLRDLAGPVPAALRRAVLRAAVCTGIDLPPVVINYGEPISTLRASYTTSAQENRWSTPGRWRVARRKTCINGKTVSGGAPPNEDQPNQRARTAWHARKRP